MKERKPLRKSILLCGESDGAAFKRTFRVIRVLGEGASSSSICYEACYDKSGRGVLKEYYPQDAYILERNKDGQLIPSLEFRDAYDRFRKEEKDYAEPYEMLLNAKRNNSNHDLATFIPAFEIYHGCDPDGNVIGTTYIWTPEPELETFDTICSETHKHPEENPEHKLVTILTAVDALTKCICALHSAEMIHRDIKPSNFGFLKRGGETLTQTLSMFDIDSICSVFGDNKRVVGTDGFMEPEARYETVSNQTDIYSIGATLFNAIIITDEVKDGNYLYRREYYDRLREMVDASRLIRASEANAHPRLRNILTVILQKCLCDRAHRYDNCEELLEDLETALYYALPSEYAKKIRSGERWILTDVEKSLDVNKEKNSFRAIQYHLYAHPLYRCSKASDKSINVLVMGLGNYGQKFLDACLQTGQMRNRRLHVTVVSDDRTDRDIYLGDRPELAKFFNIDGSLADDDETYGDLAFECMPLKIEDQSAMTDVLQNVMRSYDGNKYPQYIFIALGDDAINAAAANACSNAVKELDTDCMISCICESGHLSHLSEGVSAVYPLYVNTDISKDPLYPEIERMAFNTHLVWEKNLNVDYRKVRAEFRKPYNHDSCVSSVLALKYKLYSIGIDLETVGYEEAARSFNEKITGKNGRTIKDELIWVEHRRWVAEKLCLGWRRIENLKECAGGVTRDEKNKRHVCILRSRPDRKLATEYKANRSYEKWNTATAEDLNQLDELDRMSVELHRMFAEKAKTAKNQDLLYGSIMTGIRMLIEGNKKAMVTFQEWFTCLKDIWNGDNDKVRLYKSLKDSFLHAADALPEEQKKSASAQVKAFEAQFYPLLASMEYRDWKQVDVAFIDNIPFVLTYTEDAYLAIPYASGDNSDVFDNVSAATVVSPAVILYLYTVREKKNITDLQDSLPCVVSYMQKKHFKAAVDFVITYSENMSAYANDELKKEIIRTGGGRIRHVKEFVLRKRETAVQVLGPYLKRRSAGKRFFAVENNSTMLSAMFEGAGFFDIFANYRFDSSTMEFHDRLNCEMLGYIRKEPYITVADMLAFRLSYSESSNQPEFFEDYKDLWKKYTSGSQTWKNLCNLLGKYAENNDKLASFEKKDSSHKKQKSDTLRYIVPFACSKSVEKIIRFLEEHEIVEEGSSVIGHTTDSCEVVIKDCCGYKKLYDQLFANVHSLMLPDAISLHFNSMTRKVYVTFDDLAVKDVQIPTGRISEVSALMRYFEEKRYVINLSFSSDGKMSFTYATGQIKELLSTAGKMFEVYTYHKVKELGQFDDVVSSHEINWEGKDVKSEFDCILTKGFRTLFVECKARPVIDPVFYYKLGCLVEQFGINATAVLIADTQEKDQYDRAAVNTAQRRRGNMLNIVTIWKPDEINNIGQTLLRIVKGTYDKMEE